MILLLSDVHLGLNNDNKHFIETTKTLFNEIYDTCLNYNIKDIFFLGDFFHNRSSLNILTMYNAHEMMKIFDKFNVHIIVGNHDSFYKNKVLPSSLVTMFHSNKINIIHEPFVYNDILCVPWIFDISEINSYDCKYLFGHFDFKGFKNNEFYISKDGLDHKIFKKFDRIITGHFHTPSEEDNVTYLGSPFQQTYSDIGSKRGYYLFDDGNLKFIEFTGYSKFVKITSESNFEECDITNNFVTLVFSKDYGQKRNEELIASVRQYKPYKLKTDISSFVKEYDDENEETNTVDFEDNIDCLFSFVDNVSTKKMSENINKNVLKAMINKISEKYKQENK